MKKILVLMISMFLLGSCLIDTIDPLQIEDGMFSLKVLQLNVWNNAAKVKDGKELLADMVRLTDPHILLLCEVRDNFLINYLKRELRKDGKLFYGKQLGSPSGSPTSTVILSRFPLEENYSSYDNEDKAFVTELGVITKGIITIQNRRFAIYSVHLDWQHAGNYLPKGYDGYEWEKLPAPITDIQEIYDFNKQSGRDEEISMLIKDMEKERVLGSQIIFGGDFNEPSFADWQADTKELRDHNGVVMDWEVSKMLSNAGYSDSYRTFFPNAVTHPGFTSPAGVSGVPESDLQWSLGADGRERIDFLYYLPSKDLELKEVTIIGPKEDYFDEIIYEKTEDAILPHPDEKWFSDHKGVLATFEFVSQA